MQKIEKEVEREEVSTRKTTCEANLNLEKRYNKLGLIELF